MESKNQIRKRILNARDSISEEERSRQSLRINEYLITELQKFQFSVIHSFISMGSEVNILPTIEFLLSKRKTIVSPRTLSSRNLENRVLDSIDNLEDGIFGTQHPKNNKIYEGNIDLFLVPGVAFDAEFNRLGYGGGYYDTLLSNHRHAKKWAVCFPIQFIKEVPVESHDIKMDRVFY